MGDDFSFEIMERFGILSEAKGGWTVELTAVSWSGRQPKYDIRSWSPDHQKMGKGITLSTEELVALKKILQGMSI